MMFAYLFDFVVWLVGLPDLAKLLIWLVGSYLSWCCWLLLVLCFIVVLVCLDFAWGVLMVGFNCYYVCDLLGGIDLLRFDVVWMRFRFCLGEHLVLV